MTLCSRCEVDLREVEGFISVQEKEWRSVEEIRVPFVVAEYTYDFCSYSCLLEWFK